MSLVSRLAARRLRRPVVAVGRGWAKGVCATSVLRDRSSHHSGLRAHGHGEHDDQSHAGHAGHHASNHGKQGARDTRHEHGHPGGHGGHGVLGHGHSGDGHGHGHHREGQGHLHVLGCHDHGHSAEMSELKGEAIKVTLLGFTFNCLLGVLQYFAGNYCNSAALTSDAIHTLTDSLSDIITLCVVQLAIGPATPSFPFGRGKLDSLAALGVSGIMMGTGISAMRFSTTLFLEAMGDLGGDEHHGAGAHNDSHGHSHVHGHGHSSPILENGHVNEVAVGTCLVTIAGKEALYHITRRAADRLHSSVLLANAWHHRSDALSSGLVLLGVLGRMFVHSAFDPVAGALVSTVIIRVAFGIGRRSVAELLDMQLPKHELQELKEALKAAAAALEPRQPPVEVQQLLGRRAGPDVHLEALLTSDWRAMSAQQLAQLETSLLSELHLGGHRMVRSLRVVPRL
ncbi:MTPC1 [Symbiodinium microadriaticum]|nr:MTPC1 [Symbiodinium microadriaticum]CAE7325815.1 MTPC1 [Symbiodinium sp. KB8]